MDKLKVNNFSRIEKLNKKVDQMFSIQRERERDNQIKCLQIAIRKIPKKPFPLEKAIEKEQLSFIS